MLLHGALVGILVYGFFHFRRPPPPISALAIDATVVSQATLDAARRPAPAPPTPAPVAPTPPPEAEQTVPPPPDPAVQKAAAQEQAAHAAAAQAAQERQEKAAAKRAADQLVARKRADQAAAEEAAQEKAAAAKAAQDKAAKAKAEREAQAKAKAAAEQAATQARAEAQSAASQAELQKSIAAEERQDALRNSGAMSNWQAQIQARIQRAWIRPPSARAGLQCVLYVTQVPGGEVTDVKLGNCNGDEAVKQSILDAAYRASPLPPPPDPSLFDRNLVVTFRPTD